MHYITLRKLSIIGLLVCAAAVAGAQYIEHEFMVSPCPMCMLQRIVYTILGIVFLLGSLIAFKSILRYVYTFIILVFSSLGFYIAAKQFWLQYFAPPQRESCSAGLERLIELYPILDALKLAMQGSPECAKIDFTIFYISIAGWSVIVFGVFIILTLYIMYRLKSLD